LAAKAGAWCVSPFIGRLDDISSSGMELIRQIITIYKNYDYKTLVLVASVRHPQHVVDAALIGGHICTMPFSIFQQLFKHPLTDLGLKKFLEAFATEAGKKLAERLFSPLTGTQRTKKMTEFASEMRIDRPRYIKAFFDLLEAIRE